MDAGLVLTLVAALGFAIILVSFVWVMGNKVKQRGKVTENLQQLLFAVGMLLLIVSVFVSLGLWVADTLT